MISTARAVMNPIDPIKWIVAALVVVGAGTFLAACYIMLAGVTWLGVRGMWRDLRGSTHRQGFPVLRPKRGK
jgi:hypothetical protein